MCAIDKKIFKDIRNDIELTEIKRIKLKTEGLFFYKDLEIVTNNLCKIFKEEHLVLKEDKMLNSKCLFGQNKIIFYPYFSAVNFLIVAGINHNNEFVNELVLYFYKSNFLDKYIKEFQN